MKHSLLVTSVFALCSAAPAWASSGGKTNASGAPGSTANACNSCHNSSDVTPPVVTLEGPAALTVNTTATYRLVIAGGPAVKGGFNAKVSSGSLEVISGQGVKLQDGELTHSAAKDFAASVGGNPKLLTFDFTVRAPATAGSVTLYAAGNSVNNADGKLGDRGATVSKVITVSAVVVDPGDGGTDPGDGGTDPGDGGTTPGDGGTNPGTGGDGGSTTDPDSLLDDSTNKQDEPTGGCTAVGGLFSAPLVLAAWVALARRRRSAD